jgi:hypothetical protein
MSDAPDRDYPVIELRRQRLVAYLRHNWPQMIVDAAILIAWLFAATAVFQWLALPSWLLYVVVFVGVVVYARITPTWRRPYRSPDS